MMTGLTRRVQTIGKAFGLHHLVRAFWLSRYAPRPAPYSYGYHARRRELVHQIVDSLSSIPKEERSARGLKVAGNVMRRSSWTRDLDERIIEYPWVLSQLEPGRRILDVGCVLNRASVITFLRPLFAEIHFLNLFYEPLADRSGRLSFHCEDVRQTHFASGFFDCVVCVSTLEHIGMDNSHFAESEQRRRESPEAATGSDPCVTALTEMFRILNTNGMLVITVPFGRHTPDPAFRIFTAEDRSAALRTFQSLPAECSETFFRLTDTTWEPASMESCTEAPYRGDYAAASAVWCLSVRKVQVASPSSPA